jgi:hypothetical protein
MLLAMSDREAVLFEAFVEKASIYLEFGAGGSTCIAARHVRKIISIDSSDEWLNKVQQAIVSSGSNTELQLHKVDIGPIGDWGTPTEPTHRHKWPDYSLSVWESQEATLADLILIDGRFRVACFAEALARARDGAIIMIHDFEDRDYYHVLKRLARYIAVTEKLSIFQKDASSDVEGAERIAEEYRYEPL